MKPINSLDWNDNWWRNTARVVIPCSFFFIGLGYCTLKPQPKSAPLFKTGVPVVDSSKIKKKEQEKKPKKVKNDINLVKVDDIKPYIPQDVSPSIRKNFIEKYGKIAVAEMDKHGIPASITLAQAAIEGKWGTSILATKNKNHFGIKCFSKGCAEGHCTNYNDDHHKDFFRKYKSSEESFREHSEFLMRNRYNELKQYGKNYKSWAYGLQKFGYATDTQYAEKLIKTIELYELYKFDTL